MIRRLQDKVSKLPRRNKIIFFYSAVLLIAVVTIFVIVSVTTNKADTKNYVAKVNGVEISYDTLNDSVNTKITFYNSKEQAYDIETLRNDSLNNLVDEVLVEHFAQESGLSVSDEEIEAILDARIAQFGSEQKLADELNRLYGLDLETYKASLRKDLLREKVQSSVDQNLTEWLSSQRDEADIDWNL